ncbi:pre-B lymphocyte protein 3 [Tupaia chinensis]|nr:pre-B lymphocyte protein 3 [Tupaia chinensis]
MPYCGPAASQAPCLEAPRTSPEEGLPVCLPAPDMACGYLALLLTGAVLAVSQPALAQPDALLVFPGQVAQLSCTLSPQQATIGSYVMSWYQQQAGSAPRYLLYCHSEEEDQRPPDVPDRFSAATDVARNACILTISPVQPEDDAHYYCAVAYSSGP